MPSAGSRAPLELPGGPLPDKAPVDLSPAFSAETRLSNLCQETLPAREPINNSRYSRFDCELGVEA